MNRTATALLILSVAAPATAGVILEFTDRSPGEQASLSKAFVGTQNARIESGGQIMIFRGDKEVLWVVDPADGTYMELTKDGVAGMADAMKEMQASLASLPPEQRAMVEAMMKGKGAPGAPAPPPPLTWTANGSSDAIGGHACKGWDGARGGRVEEQICASEWTSFGLTQADFGAMMELAEFMKNMTGPMAQQQRPLMESDVPGIPLRTVVKSPQGDSIHEITKIEKSDVAASLFELPPGVKKQSMGEEPPRGRR